MGTVSYATQELGISDAPTFEALTINDFISINGAPEYARCITIMSDDDEQETQNGFYMQHPTLGYFGIGFGTWSMGNQTWIFDVEADKSIVFRNSQGILLRLAAHDQGMESDSITLTDYADAATEYRVDGTKVVGAQQAAEPNVASADATDLASAITLVNEQKATINSLLAKLRTHGLIDT